MFVKSNKINNKVNSKINSARLQKLFSDPNFTKLTILTLASCLVVYLMLPCNLQQIIHNIIQYPIIVSSLLVLCLLIGFINTPVSIGLLVMLSAIYFGKHNILTSKCLSSITNQDSYSNSSENNSNANNGQVLFNNVNHNIVEGFKSDSKEKSNLSTSQKRKYKEDEEDLQGKIKDLFAGGPFSKSLEDYRGARKELLDEEAAEDNMLKYENKRNKRSSNNSNNRKKEKFGNTSKEKFQSVPMRKFNPAEKEDTNLLLVMEHCKDIQNRIEYEYEDITYLKKYIKDKLEKIIDLLDLVEED